MLETYIENLRDDIIRETCNLINIESVSEETTNLEIPFGQGCKDALDYTLKLGKNLGFKTKNIDNYCGYIEFGKGEKLVGIIGHLDIVPSGDGWETPPFEATIKDGKIFGRGAIDDKGPVIASLYAMKAVKDNLKINSRIRLILGVNEEKDWKCINHYKEKEEKPSIGFSPDANFPCIYAEKGILTIFIKEDYSKYNNLPIKISNIDCNNNAINVVPKYCKVNLEIDASRINISLISSFLDTYIEEKQCNISYSILEDKIELISLGVQAHAAHPELGKNAISPMIILLNKLYNHFNFNLNIFEFFDKYIGNEFDGKSLNINISDESGALTLNVGNFSINNNFLQIGLNLRIPVNTPIENITKLITKTNNTYELESLVTGTQAPLYVPKNNPLVETLTNLFNKANNSDLEPIAIGGGTYARAFENCVSFGANFPEDIDMCHQANEYVNIDKLILSSKIYAEAIYKLAKI